MIPESIRTQVAVHVLEVWLLMLGFQPSGDDSVTITDYGPHRVYTVQASVPDGVVVDRGLLIGHLQGYLDEQARLPGAMRFNVYDIVLYNSPYCGNYIFASIEHTA